MAEKQTTTRSTGAAPDEQPGGDYVLPLVHVHVPQRVVDVGFWGGLAGAVALGAIDPPLGILVGAGVLVARHRRGR